MTSFTSRQRLLAALHHQEADRVPFDLASTQVTGIHQVAYTGLLQVLGLPAEGVPLCDVVQGLAQPAEGVLQRLGVDTRGLFPLGSHNWNVRSEDGGEYWLYHDEWGITHRKPKVDGLYFSVYSLPLPAGKLSPASIAAHPWPNLADPQRIAGLRRQAEAWRAAGYAVVLKDAFAGVFEMAQRVTGMDHLLMLMASEPDLAGVLFDKLVELKLAFWEMALPQLADVVDVVAQMDDYGTQESQLISPRMFRQQIKPRLRLLFERIHALAPEAQCFFHSCGNIRPLIPDLIEIGVQIINPVHVRARGMEPAALKRDFGRDLVFWGGGVDTQGVLPYGTPQEVRDDVRRNIEALAPGGGFVFNTIHNIQADVPPANLEAMLAALAEYGVYPLPGGVS